jgi:hypothetical protein
MSTLLASAPYWVSEIGSAFENVPGIVADTGLLQYLVPSGEIGLLQRLFGTVTIPAVVQAGIPGHYPT